MSKFSVHRFRQTLPTRLKIGFMLFIGSIMLFMLRSNFSIIILAMNDHFHWSNYEQHLLLSAYFYGYIGPNLIAGTIAERFGGRKVVGLVFALSSIITAMSPFMANSCFQLLFISRLSLGVCGGFFVCTCHSLISRWAPPAEKGMFVSSLLGAKLGTALTWPLMGLIVQVLDWRWAFYITALLSMVVSIFWYNIVADSPGKHKQITRHERDYIDSSLEQVLSKNTELLSVAQVMKSMPFYALTFLHFSDVWGVLLMLTSAPMFMSQVLKFDLKQAGIVSSFPFIARLMFGFVFGAAGDYLMQKGVSATKIRKMFCIFSHIIPGLILFGVNFVGNSPYVCITLITLSLGFNGAATATSSQNPQDLAPNFAGSVYGLSNFFAMWGGVISPMVVSYITREHSTMNEWRRIFFVDGAIYIISAIFFMIFGSGEVQKWNRNDSYKDLMTT